MNSESTSTTRGSTYLNKPILNHHFAFNLCKANVYQGFSQVNVNTIIEGRLGCNLEGKEILKVKANVLQWRYLNKYLIFSHLLF